MTTSTGTEPRRPDWKPEKALRVLRQQLAELQKVKALAPLEAYKAKEGWTQVPRAAIVHAFGERNPNQMNFDFAHYAQRNKNQLEDFQAVTESHETALVSAIKELELMLPEDELAQSAESREHHPSSHHNIVVFISHSSKDKELALALIELLKAGLGLPAEQIRCSSVDGYRLPVGVNTEARLREEVNQARIVVGLITPSSPASAFVMFELGARWGASLDGFVAIQEGTIYDQMNDCLPAHNRASYRNVDSRDLAYHSVRGALAPLINFGQSGFHTSHLKSLFSRRSKEFSTASIATRQSRLFTIIQSCRHLFGRVAYGPKNTGRYPSRTIP
jgi:TIR domain